MSINLSLSMSAVLSAASGPIAAHDVLVEDGAGKWVKATTANLTGGRLPRCIALTAGDASTSVAVQEFGPVPNVLAAIPGTTGEAFATVDANGHIQRTTTPTSTQVVVGWVAQDGTLYCNFSGRSVAAGGGTTPLPAGVVNATDYGYVPDSDGAGGGTDNAAAIEAADAAAALAARPVSGSLTSGNGKVIFPAGRAYCSRTIVRKYHTTWEGTSGPSVFYQGTQFDIASGQTGIRNELSDLSYPAPSGFGSVLKDISVFSLGRNNTSYLGNYSPTIINTNVAGVTATTTTGANANIVTIVGPMTWFYVGQNVTIAGVLAGPGALLPSYSIIQAINGQQLTMAYGAISAGSGQTITSHEVIVTLAAPGDFVAGDMLSVPGAGPPSLIQGGRAKCSVTIGGSVLTMTNCPDGTPLVSNGRRALVGDPIAPAYAGDTGNWVIVGTAFPTPVQVLAVTATTFTLAGSAAVTETAATINYCPHLISRVMQVRDGGITLCLLSREGSAAMTGVLIEHAECGYEMAVQGIIDGCVIGLQPTSGGFRGPGIAIYADHGATAPQGNSNSWYVNNTYSMGNKHAIAILGQDSQAGRAFGLQSVGCRDWGFQDCSQVGNAYVACHSDGGYAFLTSSFPNLSTFVNCYMETGTVSSFGDGTIGINGTISSEQGGSSWGLKGVMNQLTVGSLGYHKYKTVFLPDANFVRYCDNAVSAGANGLALRKSQPSDGKNTPGWFLTAHDLGTRSYPELTCDNATGYYPGAKWFPRGFILGDDSAQAWLDDTIARRIESRTGGGNTLGAVYDRPLSGKSDNIWLVGDTVRDTTTQDGAVLRVCTRAGQRALQWQAATVYGTGSVISPSIEQDCGFLYINSGASLTSGATEPVFSTSPATIADNGGTWTKSSASAYFQAGSNVGGYIKKSVAGSANVTLAATDKEFLTECIEVTGVIGANIVLILPLGRYKRWVFNNTTGAWTFGVKCATGNTVTIATGSAAWVVCNGTEMRRMTADVVP